jgi:sigma-B regulation protein RsbU (phosphoserine phosphatase)
VDAERLELSFSNAGHNWPVLLRPGEERRFLERGGLILGFQERVEFEEERVSLLPGDVVVLYTDGISEAADASGELFGEERLYAVLSAMPRTLPAREVTERVLATLREFLDGTEAQDDITLLVLKVLEPAAQRAGSEPATTESSSAELATRSVPSGR